MYKDKTATERAYRWIRFWTKHFGISLTVRLERISIWHVTGENGRPGCSLIGVFWNEQEACILHTRRLTEEDIVHELLHVAHPDWSEEAVVMETARQLSRTRFRRRARTASVGLYLASILRV